MQFPFQRSTYGATITWVLWNRLTHSFCHQDPKELLEAPPVPGTSLSFGNSQGTALTTAAQGRLLYRLQLSHPPSTRHHREGSSVSFFRVSLKDSALLTFLQRDFRNFLCSLKMFYFLYILKASIRKKIKKLYLLTAIFIQRRNNKFCVSIQQNKTSSSANRLLGSFSHSCSVYTFTPIFPIQAFPSTL